MREVSNTSPCSVRWHVSHLGKVKIHEVGRVESDKHDELSHLCKDLNYLVVLVARGAARHMAEIIVNMITPKHSVWFTQVEENVLYCLLG